MNTTWHYRECGCTGLPLPIPTMVDDGVWGWEPELRAPNGGTSPKANANNSAAAALVANAQSGGGAQDDLVRLRRAAHDQALRVLYLLPHHNLTGGMKMIVEHLRELMRRGHAVTAVFRGISGTPVLPPWATSVEVHAQILMDPSETYGELLRRLRGDYDVCVVGYFTQLSELQNVWAPILYWEQGHEHLFAKGRDMSLLQLDMLFHHVMARSPCALAGVSTYVQHTLALQFNRRAHLIPNAIDSHHFSPPARGPQMITDPSPGTPTTVLASAAPARLPPGAQPRVLLVGNPMQSFKGWDIALQALNSVHLSVPDLHVTWICQSRPEVQGVSFRISYEVNPPQERLPALYADGHDVFLFASRHEAWGMPVLEAMACGVPVVTTRCFGVDDFCVHLENCLMAPVLDWSLIAKEVLLLLTNRPLAMRLAANARKTAEELSWERAGDALEVALYRTALYYERQHDPPTPRPSGTFFGS